MATRTRLAHYRVPHQKSGKVHFQDENYTIKNGIVECPMEIGEANEWAPASEPEIAAYKKPVNGKKDEPPAGDDKK